MIWVWILTAIVALLAISVAIFVVKELWQTLLVLVIGGIVITLILLISIPSFHSIISKVYLLTH